ncbi:hypothetical protein ABB37_01294 [Leptomonas pyrrhocoris]|uniref:Uncharacterized protein n=1 Tax=Leptomonas pyrrhocoris TaxID=157538 RepID=A0A0N0DZ30_LEPPY|nr:hypothetical protein ABB37_01294 [Leptomonas pyrrhocoris]KPA84815.1 hypothetical protein ABB37_01294 [Leptomonas pyrrhocoris]|eukprot:XP_015663254.1 hypothetical protein ABB37_01294 [Leptomonas pyrrhocoris]
MSWVQVECSNGSRYAAPSHGRPLPNFSGAAQLFQPPLNLRELQTVDLMEINGGLDSERNHDDGVRVTVVAGQRDLGGHFGITTVIVGGEQEESEDETRGTAQSSEQASSASGGLQRLLERVFALLTTTNDRGVAILLDALCTRSPLPLTAEAASRASVVVEDDGGSHVSTVLRQARAQLPDGDAIPKGNAKASNQRFLRRLTQVGCAPSLKQESASPLQLLPPNSLTVAAKIQSEGPQRAETRKAAPSQPLSFAAAVRRRSLLFFVENNVVPLSVLTSHVCAVEVPEGHKTAAAAVGASDIASGSPTTTTASSSAANSSTPMLADTLLHSLARRVGNASRKHTSALTELQLSCTSPLRRRPSKALERNPTWAAAAQSAEESGHLLLLIFLRLLVHQPLTPTDAAQMERILLKGTWDTEALSDPSSSLAPMLAAYSPSGLLIASASFRRALGHEEYMLLSAAAIDRLTRFTPPPPCHDTACGNGRRRCADLLRWTSWPMRVGEAIRTTQQPSPTASIVDVLLLTVGDALAICVCFPRVSFNGEEEVSPAVATALSFEGVQQLLERTVTIADERDSAGRQGNTPLLPLLRSSLMDSLVHACAHSTAPYTPAFHDALFVATAVEEALGSLHFNDGTHSSALLCAANTGVKETVMGELHRLLHGEAQSLKKDASHLSPEAQAQLPPLPQQQPQQQTPLPSPSEAALSRAAEPPAAAIRTKSRSGLHKLFACLPLRRRSSRNRAGSLLDSSAYTTESLRRTGVHIQRLEGPNTTASSTHKSVEKNQHSDASRAAAAMLELPLECMLCCVAALVTRNELGALRRMHELGLHSFFYLQQNVVPCINGKSAKPPLPTRRSTPMASSSNGVGHDLVQGGTTPSSLSSVSPRFGISFTRLCLQQPQCPSAILPDEWRGVEGMRDGEGGELAFMEDPTLTLRLSIKTPSTGEHDRRTQQSAAVTVLPCWSILHLTPVELPEASSDSAGNRQDEDTDSLDGSLSSVADNDGVLGSCPASVHEDAQLLTSFCYVLTRKLHRRAIWSRNPPAVRAIMGSTSARGRGEGFSPTRPTFSSPSPALVSALSETEMGSPTADKAWVDVAAVMNICGDITGERAEALLHALQKHGLPKKAKATADGKVDGLRAPTGDGDPIEYEYVAGAGAKMKELFREALVCQEAALLLLEAASCD